MASSTWDQPAPFSSLRNEAWRFRWVWSFVLLGAFLSENRAWAQNDPLEESFVPDLTPVTLPELLREYRALGLSLPPKAAPFLRITSRKFQSQPFREAFLRAGTDFAFECDPASPNQSAKWLLGLETVRQEGPIDAVRNPIDQTVIEQTTPVLTEENAGQPLLWTPWNNGELILAIQCHAVGKDNLAQFLFTRCRAQSTIPLRQRLILLAWKHWMIQLANPDADRQMVAKRLKEMVEKYPSFVSDPTRQLIADLDRTLKTDGKKNNPIDQAIEQLTGHHSEKLADELMEFHDRMSAEIFEQAKTPNEKAMKAPLKIVRHGFAAVPLLFGHLDDHRLTRCYLLADESQFSDGIVRVEYWVRVLLNQWVHHPNQKMPGFDRTLGDYHAWWQEVNEMGEEAYLVRNLLCDQAKANPFPYLPYLHLLFLKYPDQLPWIYQEILAKKPQYDTRQLAELIAWGPFDRAHKLQWLTKGIKHEQAGHRVAALAALAKVDKKRFEAIWLEMMEANLKKDLKWDQSPFRSGIGQLAVLSEDARVWDLLLKVARAAPLEHRVAFLEDLGEDFPGENRTLQSRFLLQFFNDELVLANREEREDKPYPPSIEWKRRFAKFPWRKKIEVRNLAALKLYALWQFPENLWGPNTSEAQHWQGLRENIQVAVAKQLQEK